MEQNPGGGLKTNNSSTQVLASWSYSHQEWDQFLSWENSQQRPAFVFEALLAGTATALVIRFAEGGNWYRSLLFGVALSFLYGLARFLFRRSVLHTEPGQLPEVIITAEAVLINGRLNPFTGEGSRLGHVAIREARQLNILEISYSRKSGQRTVTAEIRVPVQKGKLREAIRVQEALTGEAPE